VIRKRPGEDQVRLAAAILTLSVIMSAFELSQAGPLFLIKVLPSLVFTVWLCLSLLKGQVWARWVTVGLAGLGGLFGVGTGAALCASTHVSAGLRMIAVGIAHLCVAMVLWRSPAVKTFFHHPVVRPENGLPGDR
jgi:hypothetical protein